MTGIIYLSSLFIEFFSLFCGNPLVLNLFACFCVLTKFVCVAVLAGGIKGLYGIEVGHNTAQLRKTVILLKNKNKEMLE